MPKTQNGGWSVAASPSQAGDSELVYLLMSPGCAKDSERRLICCSLTFTGRRLRTGLSVSVTPLQAGDSDRSFCYCPFLRRTETQNGGGCVSVSLDMPETQNCGDSVSVSPFRYSDSERGVSFGKVPLSLSDEEEIAIWRFSISRLWLAVSIRVGDTVWPTLLSSCGTYLHSPNTHLEKCH